MVSQEPAFLQVFLTDLFFQAFMQDLKAIDDFLIYWGTQTTFAKSTGGIELLRIPISKIKINPGRREADPAYIGDLAKSIRDVGLLNPITVDGTHTLIAGLHRLEAAKLLDWTEIECTVCDVDSMRAELAEIDEFVLIL